MSTLEHEENKEKELLELWVPFAEAKPHPFKVCMLRTNQQHGASIYGRMGVWAYPNP